MKQEPIWTQHELHTRNPSPSGLGGCQDYGYGLNEGSYMVAREIERILKKHGLY